MLRILPFALVLLLVAPSNSSAHRHRGREVATSFARAWSQHSVAELADLFAEDGSFTHPFATSSQSLVVGRSSLESFLKTLFTGEMSKSTYTVKENTIRERQIGPAYVIEFEATLTGAARLSGPLDHRVTMVLQQAKGVVKEPGGEQHPEHWSIAALSLVSPVREFAPSGK
jgi:uncharacterized protein (TIGR02246 family)